MDRTRTVPFVWCVSALLACASAEVSTQSDILSGADAQALDSSADGVAPKEEETLDVTGGADGEVDPSPSMVWHEACPADEREQRLIDVGDVTLNVACRGSGPTVVFLHGFPEFHFGWNKVMDELAGEYRLIAPDQRGYNVSSKPEAVDAYALPVLVDDIMTLLPLISAEPVILVAHDWGGPVGWLIAHHPDAHIRGFMATNGPHPQRFAELLATDPAQQEASSYMGLFRQPTAELFMALDALSEMFAEVLTADELTTYQAAWSQPGAITGGLNWYRANLLTPQAVDSLMAGFSPTVTVPTTVLWGLADEALLPPNAEGLEAYVLDLHVETFPGVDHWIEHRIPGEVARAIRELDARL